MLTRQFTPTQRSKLLQSPYTEASSEKAVMRSSNDWRERGTVCHRVGSSGVSDGDAQNVMRGSGDTVERSRVAS
jgi:hypothetical protein